MFKQNYKFFLLLLTLCLFRNLCANQQFKQIREVKQAHANFQDKEFINSFVTHYEFNPEGRYVHEYHPFTLRKTAESLDELEKRLQDEGFSLVGRDIILGYEENAVPNYYTDFRKAKIQDEASLKNRAGWSLRLHNRFGFMTGFLFKDLAKLPKKKTRFFQHINADTIPIFDDKASIFQEHAFGEAIDLIFKAKAHVLYEVSKGDTKKVFSWLVKFWETLYSGALKIANDQVAGTQDILFSIEYAKHLIRSNISLGHFFTGPDITYPIEVFTKQQQDVTRNSQAFVKEFVTHLEPENDQPTAYVFCSFVDGVGKSTMLGNIKNWMKYGNNIKSFEHVDNSSSQLAEIFKFKENVYIADLPAQISHFTYKPDGLVFVDSLTKYSIKEIEPVQQFVLKHKQDLLIRYQELLKEVDLVSKKNWFAADINDSKAADRAFVKNILLLKKEDNNYWIPFKYKDNYYLFNKNNISVLRYLTTLEEVSSEGLKNIESEQMLFCEGVRFPLTYRDFLDDLVQKLKDKGIKNIRFVDFASMYPRSCRENVRINYLLQQFALLDKKFDIKNSIYKDFVSGGELLYALQSKTTSSLLFGAFKLEVLVRFFLCKMIVERTQGDLSGMSLQDMTKILQQKIDDMPEALKTYLSNCSKQKFLKEIGLLEKLYGLSKSFVNIQKLSMHKVYLFSNLLQKFMVNRVKNERLNYLWRDSGKTISKPVSTNEGDWQDQKTDTGGLFKLCYQLDPLCKSELILAPVLRLLRTSWYAVLGNLLETTAQESSAQESMAQESMAQEFEGRELQEDFDAYHVVDHEKFLVPPISVKLYDHQTMQIVQRVFKPWDDDVSILTKKINSSSMLFNLPIKTDSRVADSRAADYGLFEGLPYRLDWNSRATDKNIFAFSCCIGKKRRRQSYSSSVITRYVKKYQNEKTVSIVMPASELYEKLENSVYWEMEQKRIDRQAKRNGEFVFEDAKNILAKSQESTNKSRKRVRRRRRTRRKIYLGRSGQRPAARQLIIMLATLEMIIKDPDSDIVVREGNRDDFRAAIKLFEKVTLPKYFGIRYKENLFEDYDIIEPYPSWEYWD